MAKRLTQHEKVMACSRLELAKRWGDTFLWWQVNDLVEYSGAVKAEARQQTDQIYATLLSKGFPTWADQLEAFRKKAEGPALKKEDVLGSLQVFRARLLDLGKELQPPILALIDLMGEKEFQNLIRNYRKKIEKEQREADDIIFQQKKIEDRYVSIVEFFIGGLDEEQEQMIHSFMMNESYPYKLQIKNKLHYLELIEATKGDHEKLKTLAKEFSYFDSSLETAEFQNARAGYIDKLDQRTFEVLEKMTAKQKKHLIAKLTEVVKVLRGGQVPL